MYFLGHILHCQPALIAPGTATREVLVLDTRVESGPVPVFWGTGHLLTLTLLTSCTQKAAQVKVTKSY